jgi:hypothetical protein
MVINGHSLLAYKRRARGPSRPLLLPFPCFRALRPPLLCIIVPRRSAPLNHAPTAALHPYSAAGGSPSSCEGWYPTVSRNAELPQSRLSSMFVFLRTPLVEPRSFHWCPSWIDPRSAATAGTLSYRRGSLDHPDSPPLLATETSLCRQEDVTPSFKGKTKCIDYVCARIKLHTRNDIVNTKISAT